MKYFLVGHRGVGKTTLLNEVGKLDSEFIGIDLDAEVAKRVGKSIFEIFEMEGEKQFRRYEEETLRHCLANCTDEKDYLIALGAGYQGEIPDSSVVIWIQRSTDVDGRTFLDRPDWSRSELGTEAYMSRFPQRQEYYKKISDLEWMVPEGVHSQSAKSFLNFIKSNPEGPYGDFDFTLDNKSIENSFLIHRLIQLGIRRFEIRDDLIEELVAKKFMERVGAEKILLSCRTVNGWGPKLFERVGLVDWPAEWGKCPEEVDHILSVHGKGNQLKSYSKLLVENRTSFTVGFKLALSVESFEQLAEGHKWYLEDSQRRSFLPMSKEGRWQWYRQLKGISMQLHFLRLGWGLGVNDQPLFFSHHLYSVLPFKEFAAVIGDPIHHSWTPSFQYDYFAKHAIPVVGIKLTEMDVDNGFLNWLHEIGLKFAAVTSPIKKRVYDWVENHKNSKVIGEAYGSSVNTLLWKGGEVAATNTDAVGFQALVAEHVAGKVAVWGGGGTEGIIRESIPKAIFYSARSGAPRGDRVSMEEPDLVVWAVGAQHLDSIQWPPKHWKPGVVIDLNYSENSPGREYAKKSGAEYISGSEMFKHQGLAQQQFWELQ
ncbi:MAG: hypothetical protein CL677_02820 [Bdellovibrionaceae bacterium]|nr:hypothetical protein [Pseudobdellovibrionaceae bacterium]